MPKKLTRRQFIRGTGLTVLGTSLGGGSLFARAASAAPVGESALVVVLLRGGADGLSLCPPYGDDQYYRSRPTIALDPPGKSSDSVIDLDGYFGLHPALAPLEPLWHEHQMAIVHAAGSELLSRSHFDAQEYVETGTPGVKGSSGILARSLDGVPGAGLFEGAAIGKLRPRALLGPQAVLVADRFDAFSFSAPGWQNEAELALFDLYASSSDAIGRLGVNTIESIRTVRDTQALREPPSNGAIYPDSSLGARLLEAARLIKSRLGTRCIFIDVDGDFDTHSRQQVNNQKEYVPLARALSAFHTDLGSMMEQVQVIVLTEFGRAVYETGAAGTDHGTGGAMLLLGGHVAGGKVHGRWPGIEDENLFEGRDLAATTDYRDVLIEIFAHHLEIPHPAWLFPGHDPRPVGLYAS